MKHENPTKAFVDAINAGRLNENESSELYAGNWMYMFTNDDGVSQFKNIDTREYLKS